MARRTTRTAPGQLYARGAWESLEGRRLMSAYSLIDLGTLGGTESRAFDLNNANQVVGYSTTATGQERGFVFADANGNGVADPGEMKSLGVLSGDAASYAYGIDDGGHVVGSSRAVPIGTDGDERAVQFGADGTPVDLGLGRGSNGYGSSALDANAAAQVVGGAVSGVNYVPFVRSAAGAVTTFTLPAPYNLSGEARAINEAGVVVGYSGSFAGDSGFVRLPDGTITPVGHDNPALPYNYAWDVNNAGQVVGEGFNSAGDYRAFLWEGESATDLGTLTGMGSSEAYGLNAAGTVVGRVEPPDGTPGATRAFVYHNGVMRDLNELIPANSGWFVAEARAVNDGGAIAAVAHAPGGAVRAVLLMPAPGVAGRYVFYNNSAFDGRDPAATAADDAAVAPDKQPRVATHPPSFSNVTSYSRGINGVMVDLAAAEGEPGEADFRFRVRGGADNSWSPAPRPQSVSVRPGAGAAGSDRVTITWDDGAIRNTWLEVTVLPTQATGLVAPDVFSFGNLVGETGDLAAPAGTFAVGGNDLLSTRARMNMRAVQITDRYDFNRDRTVNSLDLALVRTNFGKALEGADLVSGTVAPPLPVDELAVRRRPTLCSDLHEVLA